MQMFIYLFVSVLGIVPHSAELSKVWWLSHALHPTPLQGRRRCQARLEITDAQGWMQPWALIRPIALTVEDWRNQGPEGKEPAQGRGLWPLTSPHISSGPTLGPCVEHVCICATYQMAPW